MHSLAFRSVLLAVISIAANASATQDSIEQLAGTWDNRCSNKGCVMFTDVLRGDPDHPADLKNPEYLTIAVAIDRETKRPAYFAFHVPPNADRSQGLFIKFSRTVAGPDGKWHLELEKALPTRLEFESCSRDSCVARVKGGSPESDKLKAELADKFFSRDHIMFLYVANGEPLRAMKALFPFRKAHEELIETQLK